jgi:hypothetical protein
VFLIEQKKKKLANNERDVETQITATKAPTLTHQSSQTMEGNGITKEYSIVGTKLEQEQVNNAGRSESKGYVKSKYKGQMATKTRSKVSGIVGKKT